MKNIYKKITASLLLIIFVFTTFSVNVYAEDEYSVEVHIISDNITLAQYKVLSKQITSLTILSGDRATFGTDAHGIVNSITVNGKVLKQDNTHNIKVYHNNNEIQSYNIKVDNDDIFTFKYITDDNSVLSSNEISSDTNGTISKPEKPAVSNPKIEISSADISDKTQSNVSDVIISSKEESLFSSEAVSSEENKVQSTQINPNKYEWNNELTNILDDACSWLSINDESVMQLIAMSSAGRPAKANAVDRFMQDIKENNGVFKTDNEIFFAILSSTFAGLNAEDVRGIDLIQKMLEKKYIYRNNSHDAAMMLISLDCDDYKKNDIALRNDTVDSLITLQNKDGGFSIKGKKSDLQITTTVLIALSKYKFLAADTISKAVGYISDYIKTNYYKLSGAEIAKTIIAINSLSLSMDDEKFLVNSKNLVDTMKSYISLDGGFKDDLNGESSAVATEYFVLALVSLKNGMSPYIINYQSQSVTTDSNLPKNHFNFILTLVLAFLFLIIVGMMIFGFIYSKKKHLKGFDDTIKFIFENKK